VVIRFPKETRTFPWSFRKSDGVRLALAAMDLAGEPVAQAVIRDLDGQPHALGELWSERPAVLVFLRHFG
jgi:hypothetical protein